MPKVQERVQDRGFSKRLILTTISAVLLAISMPGMVSSIFVWVGFVPLFYVLEGRKWWKGFLWGWCWGVLYLGSALYWILPTLTSNISEFNGFPAILGGLAFFVALAIEGGFWGVIGLIYSLESKYSRSYWILRALSLSSVYVLVEYLRGVGDIGFTGARISNALYSQIGMLQLVPFIGTLGLVFLIFFINYSIYSALKRKRFITLFVISGMILTFYLSSYLVPNVQSGNGLTIGVVQPNLSVAQRYEMTSSQIAKDVDSSVSFISKEASLVIFPEGTFQSDFIGTSAYGDVVETLEAHKAHAIIGYPSIHENKFYNTVGLFSSKGVENTYSKHVLVPFTEALPYPEFFGMFGFLKLTQFFSPGGKFTVFKWDDTKFSVQICFESYFSRLSRKFTNEGAQFLVTVTNDSWFSQPVALKQHFAQSVFRAVENRKWAIQVADTGITGVIDPYGRVIKKVPIRKKGESVFSVVPNKERTFYDRFGNWINWLSILFIVLDITCTLRKVHSTDFKI